MRALAVVVMGQAACCMAAERMPLEVEQQADRLQITSEGRAVATFVFRDEAILRPYFANVHAPGAAAVTRRHPPREGIDAVDHATMHPGIWLAFGDLAGGDFWRNKGTVEHVEFVEPPEVRSQEGESVVRFAARHRYVAGDKTVCTELARYSVRAGAEGFLFSLDSEFTADAAFSFGDQEEMGLGVRLATPLAVKGGSGKITSSELRTNEREVWGRQAEWCDYSGVVAPPAAAKGAEMVRAGVLVVPHPENFRPSWMHVRDYGLLVANPFGQRAFTGGAASRLEVRPGEKFRLRFGVWAYSCGVDDKVDLAGLARRYVDQSQSP
jgi:hypothetical protein